MFSYKYIIDPKTKIKVTISSKRGKKILLNYLNQIGSGSLTIFDESNLLHPDNIKMTRLYKTTDEKQELLNNLLERTDETKFAPPIYMSLHGDNLKFKKDIDLERNLERLVFRVPDNLFVIHFFIEGLSGSSWPHQEAHIRKKLSNSKWIWHLENVGKENLLLRNNEHLYLPGQPIYNQLLQWDWGKDVDQKTTQFDIYELDPENISKKFEEIDNDLESLSGFKPGGDKISYAQKMAWEKELRGGEDSFEGRNSTLRGELSYISQKTPDQYRMVYIFNCDPRDMEQALHHPTYFQGMILRKEVTKNFGRDNFDKFLRFNEKKFLRSSENPGLVRESSSTLSHRVPFVASEDTELETSKNNKIFKYISENPIETKDDLKLFYIFYASIVGIHVFKERLKTLTDTNGYSILDKLDIDWSYNIENICEPFANYIWKNKEKSNLGILK